MGALTLKEAVGLPVESLQTAQFRHGPLELAGLDLAAMVIATEPETRDLDLATRRRARAVSAPPCWTVTAGVRALGATRSTSDRIDRLLAPAARDRARAAPRVAARDPSRGREPGAYVPRREGDDP